MADLNEGWPILKIGEIAELLRVSPSTIRRLMRDEGLPFIQVGGKWAALGFKREAVLEWYESHQHPTPARVKADILKSHRRKA